MRGKQMAYAQAGEETARQLDPNATAQQVPTADAGFAQYLADQRSKLSQVQTKQTEAATQYGPTGTIGNEISRMGNVADLPVGYAPSRQLGTYTQTLGQQRAYQSNLNEQEVGINENIIKTLAAIFNQEEKNLDIANKKADLLGKGYKADGQNLIPLTEAEKQAAGFVGESAVAEVIKQGGRDFITGGSAAERQAIAEEILRSGGVKEYRKLLPLTNLVSTTELNALQDQTDLDVLLSQAINYFENNKSFTGTGLFAQLVPGAVAGETTREMRRQIETIKALYAKAISGATISDREMKRLATFLPSSGKNEAENLGDLEKLQRDIKINQEIFELGKREGLTSNQAFDKYGKEIFSKYGVDLGSDEKTNGLVVMIGPDGKKWNVKPEKVATFEQNGYRRAE
jgi:hypothetical protein